jgi:hypothetical protein
MVVFTFSTIAAPALKPEALLPKVLDQLITCHDDSLIPDDLYQDGRDHFNKTLGILNGCMSWLKRSAKAKDSATDPISNP